MSSPVLAGAAGLTIAMLRSRGYSSSPEVVQRILEASAKKDPGLSEKIQDGNVLDLKRLVEYIVQAYPEHNGGEPIPAPMPPECHP